mgnify:CR=1 FL=1
MRNVIGSVSVTLAVFMLGSPALGQSWTITWQGEDRPGGVNGPFDTSGVCGLNSPFICGGGPLDGQPCLSGSDDECIPGWPLQPAAFEQHDPNGCYDPQSNGPYYAENANVDTDGYLAIQNVQDGTCEGIGNIIGGGQGPCGDNNFLPQGWDLDVNPCGMRYFVGPRTLLNFWGPENENLIHYQAGFGFGNPEPAGAMIEASFYIASLPKFHWQDIMRMRGFYRPASPQSNPQDTSEVGLAIRDGVHGAGEEEFRLVVFGGNSLDLGPAENFLNRWITVRLAVAVGFGKQQKIGWIDNVWIDGPVGWRDISPGGGEGSPHSFAYFGWAGTDTDVDEYADIRYGTMAFTNQGIFSPNPGGNCHNIFLDFYLPYLSTVEKTRTNPEICDNSIDDDGDGETDCEDDDCWQSAECGNLLVNGSFEEATVNSTVCPILSNTNRPTGWNMMPGDQGNLLPNSTIHIPSSKSTHASSRGSIDKGPSSGGPNRAFQMVDVLPGPITLKGFIAGEGLQYRIFAELLDGDFNSTTVIDRFEVIGDNLGTYKTWQEFSLSGQSASGRVTVRWGLDGSNFSIIRAAHIDNLYLVGTVPPPCNIPFADADADGDVDADDFGIVQRCISGSGNLSGDPLCICFDVEGPGGNKDGDIDQGDLLEFSHCATGPDVAFVANNHPNCDP